MPARANPSRDRAVPAVAGVLALLALPATGWLPAAWLPSAPAGYHVLALAAAAFVLLVVGAGGRAARPWRPLHLLLAALPCLYLGILEGGRGWASRPGTGWWALVVAAAVLAALRTRRRVAVAALATWLGASAVLAAAGAPLLPPGWNAWTEPVARADAGAMPARHGDLERGGLRVGAAVRPVDGVTPALGEGPGTWRVEAARAERPGPRPVVLAVGTRGTAAPPDALGGATIVSDADIAIEHAHDLRALDAVLVPEHGWREDDPSARAKADAVAGFVRAGGLLIGPAPERTWPPQLGPRLRHAGRAHLAGPAGVRRLGLGRVARAGRQSDIADILAADLWVRDVGSPLLDPRLRPRPPAGFEAWRDDPRRRRPQGVLLLVHALVLLAFARLLRGGAPQAMGTFLAAAAVAAGLAWTSPADPGVRVHGLALDLGGAGGRRVEAVWIAAGPGGYDGRVRWSGGGVVGLRGGFLGSDGRLRLEPGRSAWVVRDTVGRGVAPGESEDRRAAVLRPLLVGAVDPRRLRYGRSAALPVRVEGWGAVSAWTAVLRAPAE